MSAAKANSALTVSTTSALEVPNGNSVMSPQIAKYVDRYNTFLAKTAESILGLAETLIEAETTLNGVDFAIFCDNAGIEKGGSTYTKLKKIGDTAARFKPFMTKLPNTWTTIYKLAKLDAASFDRIAAKLSPFITATEIDTFLGAEKGCGTKRSDLMIDLDTLDLQQKSAFYSALQELKKKYGFSITERRTLIDELKSATLAKAA
jgi:hypothetical protein